ncbi:PREDICTED: COBRA-like protein 6 [Fragaria vesca subsp. vesca]|uniref:COBRA-like protein 6 n=1 Tax=Fragaria vesca subsp. vesca TaxID=101020 RepID=UPI0002C31693|nr:PREDICTED: COBRA-like protein 6 [Fragaria vesca subsp. vesca]
MGGGGGGGGDVVCSFTFTLSLTMIIFFLSSISLSYGYDPLDPYGNVTITWDFLAQSNTDTYDIKVSIYNLQQYRHVEFPGWRLQWKWNKSEVIWDMRGAEAVEQGDCSAFKGSGAGDLPHCCLRRPVITDLLPGTPYNMQYKNCCKGGVLSSMNQDPSKYLSSFGMSIGNFHASPPGLNSSLDKLNLTMPTDFNLGIPGYTCGDAFLVPPTRYIDEKGQGRRWKQTLETWNITCTYSQFQASRAPKCCVSLSAFYNTTIVGCPRCSCGCQRLGGAKCIESGDKPPPSVLKLPTEQQAAIPPPLVTCSQHMCPIRVHWHVKQSYKEYWRVKITITNLNFLKNYTDWNLVVQHPNLKSIRQLFSFNYHPLTTYGNINDTGMFWGIKFYNDMILTSGNQGNAQSEMLLHKDEGTFTFREGWAFPRRISFNGDDCVMPPPDDYPTLPNIAATLNPYLLLVSFMFLAVAVPALF